jgi:hypothetical protein
VNKYTYQTHPDVANCDLQVSERNIPLASNKNILLAQFGQCGTACNHKTRRRYTKAYDIEALAVYIFRTNGKGLTFNDLLLNGIATRKQQAQVTLKYCFRRNVLFVLRGCKPQQYYPTCLKSEILKKNIPIEPTGVRLLKDSLFRDNKTANRDVGSCARTESMIAQTLEGYVLPLLPKAPLHIHKLQFKVKIPAEYYQGIPLAIAPWNKSKEYEEIIGTTHARYCFYANGTVMVSTESSNNPFKLENDCDLGIIIAFFGQLRDRLIVFLRDRHERVVPGIMEWVLTQWDVNKDIRISDLFHYSSINIQVKHLTHLFRIYFKSMGKETVCRVEESCTSKGSYAIETINTILNPCERLEKKIDKMMERLIH